jgi:hypothetical protein
VNQPYPPPSPNETHLHRAPKSRLPLILIVVGAVIAVAVTAFGFARCSAGAVPEPKGQAYYLNQIRELFDQPPYSTVPDETLIRRATETCEYLAVSDGDIAGLMRVLDENSGQLDAMTVTYSTFITFAAIPAYCPQYIDELEAYRDALP